MEQGIVSRILTDSGEKEEFRALCTFSVDRGCYILAIDSEDECFCGEIKRSWWKGTYLSTKPVGFGAMHAAKVLMRRAESEPGRFAFKGEHYGLDMDSECVTIRRLGRMKFLKPGFRAVPIIPRLLIVIFVSVIFGWFFSNSSAITVAKNVFGGLSRQKLIFLIYAIQIVGAAALLLIREDRGIFFDLIIYAFVPYYVLALVGYVRVSRVGRIAAFSIFAVFILAGVLPKIIQAVKTGERKKRFEFWKTALHRFCTPVIACAFAAFAANNFFGIHMYMYSGGETDEYVYQCDDSYLAAVNSLRAEVWDNCSVQEKLDILQTICNYECERDLGCKTPVIVSGYMERDEVKGDYNDLTNTICLPVEDIENDPASFVLSTVLHETRHAYQHAVVKAFNAVEDRLSEEDLDLSCFRFMLSYRDSMDNYSDGRDDFYTYYGQYIESDSREWAAWKILHEYDIFLYPD